MVAAAGRFRSGTAGVARRRWSRPKREEAGNLTKVDGAVEAAQVSAPCPPRLTSRQEVQDPAASTNEVSSEEAELDGQQPADSDSNSTWPLAPIQRLSPESACDAWFPRSTTRKARGMQPSFRSLRSMT